jgi:N-acetylneuraminic acid mutarotase
MPTTTTTSSTTASTTTTTTEPPLTWARLQPAGETPSPRCYQSMVYDGGLRKIIMFAGFDGTLSLSETWVYDPSENLWSKREVTDVEEPPWRGPSAGGRISAVYEALTGRVVAFDGNTWAYDPGADRWKDLKPKGDRPSARLGSCMAYDWVHGKVVLFGGTDMATWFNDTWIYDAVANTWTQMTVGDILPPGRSDASMAYDPQDGRMILFGGVADFSCLDDTWAYDLAANTWVQLAPDGATPPARCGHIMVYDPDRTQLVLFGGIDSDFGCYNDTWSYDAAANTWTNLIPSGDGPPARGRSSAVYVPIIDKLLLFGGSAFVEDPAGGFGTQVYFDDLWSFGVEG